MRRSDGQEFVANGKVGQTVLDLMINNNLIDEIFTEFGICKGIKACTSCHVHFRKEDFLKLAPMDDQEKILLIQTIGRCHTSRLGCQVSLTSELNGAEIYIPDISTENN